MNRITAIALLAGAILLTTGRTWAQSAVVEIAVPFNFTVNNAVLPAGNYTFGYDLMVPDLLVVRDRANNVVAKYLGLRGSINPGKPDTLIFHRYGGQYFLSAARIGSDTSGIFLPATTLEKQASKVRKNEEFASIAIH